MFVGVLASRDGARGLSRSVLCVVSRLFVFPGGCRVPSDAPGSMAERYEDTYPAGARPRVPPPTLSLCRLGGVRRESGRVPESCSARFRAGLVVQLRSEVLHRWPAVNDLRALCRIVISIAARANRRSVLNNQSACTPASRSAKNDAEKRVLTHCIRLCINRRRRSVA